MMVLQVMVFRRRSSALRPVNSIKHVIDTEGALAMTGASSISDVVVAVPNLDPNSFTPNEVRVGAKVNGFFISVFIIGSSGAGIGASINWYIIKVHDQQTVLPLPGETGSSAIRNQIFHEEKGLAGSADGTPMAFKGVIAVPKGMRRMRQGDKFQIVIALNAAATDAATFCLKAIYKSYF